VLLKEKKKEQWQNINGEQGWVDIQNANHLNLQYCECPTGAHGNFCEIESSQCGDLQCLNGGVCAETLLSNGAKDYHCDCTPANNRKISFAGRMCQYKSSSTCFYDESTKESTFCVHDGVCPLNPHEDCKCPGGFTGSHCEFHTYETSKYDYAQCNLKCQNGGKCRKGLSSNSDPGIDSLDPEFSNMILEKSSGFEHCACPPGFVGLHCEYPYVPCGNDDHPCFHGSTCSLMQDGSPTCLCSEAAVDSAGTYCQHIAEDICFDSHSDSDHVESTTESNRGFCVNRGVCIVNEKNEAACRCREGSNGPHCEYIDEIMRKIPPTAKVIVEKVISKKRGKRYA